MNNKFQFFLYPFHALRSNCDYVIDIINKPLITIFFLGSCPFKGMATLNGHISSDLTTCQVWIWLRWLIGWLGVIFESLSAERWNSQSPKQSSTSQGPSRMERAKNISYFSKSPHFSFTKKQTNMITTNAFNHQSRGECLASNHQRPGYSFP